MPYNEDGKFDMTPIFEAMSAMQKSIRRNDIEKAYYFALVLEEFNPKMLWNRLQIIVSEDIGRGNPSLPATFEVLKKWYFDDLDKGNNGTLYLSHLISLMASGDKCRDADNLVSAVKKKMHFVGKYIPIPDYAYDNHTLQGKKMGRGSEFFWSESVKLANDISNKEIFEQAKAMSLKYKDPKEGFSQTRRTLAAYNKQKGFRSAKDIVKQREKIEQKSITDEFYDETEE